MQSDDVFFEVDVAFSTLNGGDGNDDDEDTVFDVEISARSKSADEENLSLFTFLRMVQLVSVVDNDPNDHVVVAVWEKNTTSTNTVQVGDEEVLFKGVAVKPHSSFFFRFFLDASPRRYVVTDPRLASALSVSVGDVRTLADIMKALSENLSRTMATTPTTFNMSSHPLSSCFAPSSSSVSLSQLVRTVLSELVSPEPPICLPVGLLKLDQVRSIGALSLSPPKVFSIGLVTVPKSVHAAVRCATLPSGLQTISQHLNSAMSRYEDAQHPHSSLSELHKNYSALVDELQECYERQKVFAAFAADPSACLNKMIVDMTRDLRDVENPRSAPSAHTSFFLPEMGEAVKKYLEAKRAQQQ
eukprot:PhM_4_TR3086/c1_g1_i2/m.53887